MSSHRRFSCDGFTDYNDFKSKFEHYLFLTKGGLLAVLILVSIVYQVLYSKNKQAATLLSTKSGKIKVLTDSCVTALFGILSAMFVVLSRYGINSLFTFSSIKIYVIVGLILGTFVYSQEASGFNRYTEKSNIENKTGIYYELDKDTTATTCNDNLEKLETGGDPFTISSSYLFLITVILLVLAYITLMFKATLCGYKSGLTKISSSHVLNDTFTPKLGFSIELLVVGLLNFIPPLISPKIRGETTNKRSIIIAVFTMIVAITLQIMLQYTGMLKGI